MFKELYYNYLGKLEFLGLAPILMFLVLEKEVEERTPGCLMIKKKYYRKHCIYYN